jgi:divinyl protochlorophyllide a 8-vinyl-reductase
MSAVAHAGQIGPNAITRVAQVLPHRVGALATRELFQRAGIVGYLLQPPERMVDEAEVMRLHAELRRSLGGPAAQEVAREAGRLTGEYLLARRIPRAVQALLRVLPARLAARVLLAAITRHAWTFAGSGEFSAKMGRGVQLTLRNNPLCRGWHSEVPACDFYAATFERLFSELVHHRARVVELSCEACGSDACRFEVHW